MNHALASRSRNSRYVAPSLTVTSHSSRSHGLSGSDLPAPPALPATPSPKGSAHHWPDVRHGPAALSMHPPVIPLRSVVTRTGRPSSTSTRAGTANRNRRSATTTRGCDSPDSTSVLPTPPTPPTLPTPPPDGASTGAKGAMENAPGRHESTTAGDPQRPSPISAFSRAISVDTCSGDGSGRVSSEYCRTRAG